MADAVAAGDVQKCLRPRFQPPVIMAEAPSGRDGTCIACHCLLLAVLIPRRFNVSAAACVERCAVSVMMGRTASASRGALLGFGDALKIF